jgi:hypothetical protein
LARPIGVIIVSVLTLISSFFLAQLFLLIFFLNFGGIVFASGGGPSLALYTAYVLFPPLFAFFSFASSIVLLVGFHSKLLWRMMTGFWGALFVYMLWWGYAFVWHNIPEWFSSNNQVYLWQYGALAIPFVPLAYSLGCLVYFQKANVNKYFSF